MLSSPSYLQGMHMIESDLSIFISDKSAYPSKQSLPLPLPLRLMTIVSCLSVFLLFHLDLLQSLVHRGAGVAVAVEFGSLGCFGLLPVAAKPHATLSVS